MTGQSSNTPKNSSKYIYKIAPSVPKPTNLESNSDHADPSKPVLPPSDLDVSSNFIHMSTAAQIPGTLKHFFLTSADERNVVYILKMSLQPLEGTQVVRWESPDAKICGTREGEGMFPHLYFDDLIEGVELGANVQGEKRRLWLKRGEVEGSAEVVSEVGCIGWEDGLRKFEKWLV